MMSKIIYFVFGHKTVINATFYTFTRQGSRIIRQVAVGHKSYLTTKHDEPGYFVISSMDGIEQFINLSKYITN